MSQTVAEIEAQLVEWRAALSKLSMGQEYTIGGVRNGRQLKRADLPEVRNTIDWLESKLARAEAGNQKITMRRVVI